MRLEADPRLNRASLFEDAKDWMRRAALLLNGNGDALDAQALAITALQAETARGPAFRAKRITTDQAMAHNTALTVLFNSEDIDTANAYDPATGRFTPQVAGLYQINWVLQLLLAQPATLVYSTLQKNGTDHARGNMFSAVAAGGGQLWGLAGSTVVELNGSTDYVSVQAQYTSNPSGTASVSAGSGIQTHFSGFLARRTP